MAWIAVPIVAGVLVIGVWPAGAQAQPAGDPAATRAAFLEVIARPRVPAALSPSTVTTERGYRQERLSFLAEADERVPVLILSKGDAPQRRAVVIVLHGTNGTKEAMPELRETYADRGFLVVSMDARHHGERAVPGPGLPNAYQSAMLRAYQTGGRHPYLYDTVWDVVRLIDVLTARSDVDAGRIGLVGNSKGGTEAYLAAAADERIAVVVPLIGVQSFGWSLRNPAAWEARTWTFRAAVEAAAAGDGEPVTAAFMQKFYDRIAPGLVDRFDGPGMLPLIAPRPLLIVNGDSDPRSPLGGVREAVAAAERAYAGAQASDRLAVRIERDTAHTVTPEAHAAVLEWFVRWLRPLE